MSVLFWKREEPPPPPHNQEPLRFDLHGAVLRGADMKGFLLEEANLERTDAANASFRGADFKNANLDGTILKGADLTDAKNLTVDQLEKAVIDETTKLPADLATELRARRQLQRSDA
jgi:uncharacterized protein YjbI with pentapeptide repeats